MGNCTHLRSLNGMTSFFSKQLSDVLITSHLSRTAIQLFLSSLSNSNSNGLMVLDHPLLQGQGHGALRAQGSITKRSQNFFMAFGAYWCYWELKQVWLDYLKCVEWHFEKNWEQLLSPMIFGPKTPESPMISTSIDACVATANELAKAKITFAKRNILLSNSKSCITKSTKKRPPNGSYTLVVSAKLST